ncbi:DUF2510 domain-containing protein, partial [Streptomyces bacillaris]|uniref:DUF2510 domain-containing protein n=1 Tax=Streptomyces bacillaris TaxID=68179 RepID=UPI0036DBA80D
MSNPSLPPAGWYPNPENPSELRWWDGAAWSARTAEPGTVVAAPATTDSVRSRTIPVSTWIGGSVAVFFSLFTFGGGFGSFLVYVAMVAGVTALYSVITGRRSWASLPKSRPIAGAIAAGSLVLLLVGTGISGAGHPASLADASTTVSSKTPTPATATPTPSSTPTDMDAPLDPSTVVAADSGPSVVIANNSTTTAAAVDVLATLPVKGKAASTGYARTTDFGAAWLDVDHNGCDTRNDILARDLTGAVKQGSCTVVRGTLANSYTGQTIDFVRGATTSALVQIDHIVPLQNAWVTGAQQLTQAQRVSLANDPLN